MAVARLPNPPTDLRTPLYYFLPFHEIVERFKSNPCLVSLSSATSHSPTSTFTTVQTVIFSDFIGFRFVNLYTFLCSLHRLYD